MRFGLAFSLLFVLISAPAYSRSGQSSCELVDGYFVGMSAAEVVGKYNEKKSDASYKLLCLKFGSSASCSGLQVLGINAHTEFNIDNDRLYSISAKFSTNDFASIRRAFLKKFGKPKTVSQCKKSQGDQGDGCETIVWTTRLSTVQLEQRDANGESSFVVGPDTQKEGAVASAFSLCIPAAQPESAPPENRLEQTDVQQNNDVFETFNGGDKQLVTCVLPRARNGKYSVYDPVESVTPLIDACNTEFGSSLDSCRKSGGSSQFCMARTVEILRIAIGTANTQP